MSNLDYSKWLLSIKYFPSSSSELYDDMVYEILLRFHPEILALLKCVSKQYLRIINNPLFDKQYRSQHPNKSYIPAGVFCQHPLTNRIYFSSTVKNNEREAVNKRGFNCIDKSLACLPCSVSILASRSGLILCRCMEQNKIFYYVNNPVTKQYASLPVIENDQENFYVGFFVDSKFGHYKVVRIQKSVDEKLFASVQTFCSEVGKWLEKKFMVTSSYCSLLESCTVVQFGSILCWVDLSGNILAYNVKNEKFGFMKLPDMPLTQGCKNMHDHLKKGLLGVSGRSLYYASIHENFIRLWVRDVRQWRFIYNIDLTDAIRNYMWNLQDLDNLEEWIKPYWHLKRPSKRPLKRPFNSGDGLNVDCTDRIGHGASNLGFKLVAFDEFDQQKVYLTVHGWVVSFHFMTGEMKQVLIDSKQQLDIDTVFPFALPEFPFSVKFSHS